MFSKHLEHIERERQAKGSSQKKNENAKNVINKWRGAVLVTCFGYQ